MTSPIIVDANVPCHAGKPASELQTEDEQLCADKCIDLLHNIIQLGTIIVVDSHQEILEEYRKVIRVNMRHEPNMTSVFYRRIMQKLAEASPQIEVVELHQKGRHMYEEYPEHPALSGFDPPDKKYIALANVHSSKPHIVNATDTDWWHVKSVLAELGIIVDFLHEPYILNHLH